MGDLGEQAFSHGKEDSGSDLPESTPMNVAPAEDKDVQSPCSLRTAQSSGPLSFC